jgi:transposase
MPRPKHPQLILKQQEDFKKNFGKMLLAAKMKAQQKNLKLKLMFQDEARFGRLKQPKRCWAPRHIQPEVPSQIIREYEYVYGVVDPHKGDSLFFVLPSMETECLNLFLKIVSENYKEYLIVMVLDGASSHRAKDKLMIPDNIILINLPPYSPQLNPVEKVWDYAKRRIFKNNIFPSLDAMEDKIILIFRALEYNKNRIRKIAGFPWIIINSLYAFSEELACKV